PKKSSSTSAPSSSSVRNSSRMPVSEMSWVARVRLGPRPMVPLRHSTRALPLTMKRRDERRLRPDAGGVGLGMFPPAIPYLTGRQKAKGRGSELQRRPGGGDDEDLAVAHAAGAGGADDAVGHLLGPVRAHPHADLHLRQEGQAVLAAQVAVEVAL